jgi:hypothetical protein
MLLFYFQAVKSHATHVMSLLDRLMPALPDLQEAATLLSGSVYTANNFAKSVYTANSFPFMYSQKIF